MKNVIKIGGGILVGMLIMFVGMKLVMPFEYSYDKENEKITFNVDNEIVSDYNLVEWRFEENRGSTFEIYFEGIE